MAPKRLRDIFGPLTLLSDDVDKVSYVDHIPYLVYVMEGDGSVIYDQKRYKRSCEEIEINDDAPLFWGYPFWIDKGTYFRIIPRGNSGWLRATEGFNKIIKCSGNGLETIRIVSNDEIIWKLSYFV